MQNTFSLFLKQKEFKIPSYFQYIKDINNDIYISLLKNREYKVMSDITEEIFQSFINYWIRRDIPEITNDNIDQYDLISTEFDCMTNIIQLFRNITRKNHQSLLLTKNNQYKDRFSKKKEKLEQRSAIFHQIIENLFGYIGLDSYIEFLEANGSLLRACEDEDPELVKILNQKQFKQNGFVFKLNNQEKTAGYYRFIDDSESIFIQESIDDVNFEDYSLTSIYPKFLQKSDVKSVTFSDRSELKTIGRKAFFDSKIEKILLPASVETIGEKAFAECRELKSFKFQSGSLLKLIDVKAFASSSIECLIIPPSVTHIKKCAFEYCSRLSKVEFSKNSKLKVIEERVFQCCSLIEVKLPSCVEELKEGWCDGLSMGTKVSIVTCKKQNIKFYNDEFIIGKSDLNNDTFDVLLYARRDIETAVIPSFIKHIAPFAFGYCHLLMNVMFEPDSELIAMEPRSFFFSYVRTLLIPPKVSEFKEGWCFNTPKLTQISLMPKNKNAIFFNNNFLIGKSDPNGIDYDVLLFARRDIESAVIPSFVKHIAPFAFDSCFKLTDVIFTEDSQLLSIGCNAFHYTSLQFIVLPPRPIQISENAFSINNIFQSIDFQNNPDLFIINNIFDDNEIDLVSLSIPSNVIEFAKNWCFGLYHLADITIYPNDEENIIYYDNKYILGKSDLQSDVYDIIYFARRDIDEATIPPFIKKIASCSFKDCSFLDKITFCESCELEIIDDYAFYNSSIQNLLIPSSVTKIGKYAFAQCKMLTKLEFCEYSNLILIDKFAFSNSPFDHICVPSSVSKIGESAFYECPGLQLVEFENNSQLQVIEEKTFQSSSLGFILVPPSVTRIKKNALSYCSQLNFLAFEDNSQIQSIEKKAAYSTAILLMKFPQSLVRIEEKAFAEGKMLQKIEFMNDSKIKFIDKDAFCLSPIKVAELSPSLIKIGIGAFNKCNRLQTIQIPDDSELKLIDDHAFEYCAFMNLFVPSSVERIGEYAFNQCQNLQNIEFGENSILEIIEKYAFTGTSIENISIPSDVSIIGEYAFSDCDLLRTVNLPIDSKLELIENCLFCNSSIESIDIPPSVEDFLEGWCFGTPNLKALTLMPNCKNFTSYDDFILGKSDNFSDEFDIIVFANRDIKFALIPPFIKTIASCAFNSCYLLKEVQFAEDSQLTSIDENAFSSSSIRAITIPSTVKTIEGYAFSDCEHLSAVNFEDNSGLYYLGIELFGDSLVGSLIIPPSILELRNDTFLNSHHLKIIELDEKSELISINAGMFNNSSVEIILAPKNLSKLFI